MEHNSSTKGLLCLVNVISCGCLWGLYGSRSFLPSFLLCVYLKKDLPDTNESYDADSVIDAIESVMPAIEVVDDRWNNYKLIDTPTLIADDFFGAGCV